MKLVRAEQTYFHDDLSFGGSSFVACHFEKYNFFFVPPADMWRSVGSVYKVKYCGCGGEERRGDSNCMEKVDAALILMLDN